MKLAGRNVLVCNCQKTMAIDGNALAKAVGSDTCQVAEHLCRRELPLFQDAVQQSAEESSALLVACTQEAPLFRETLDELAGEPPEIFFVNIRERANWSDDGRNSSSSNNINAKMAALLKRSHARHSAGFHRGDEFARRTPDPRS